MFIKACCPVCGTDVYHNVRLHALEYLSFEGGGEGEGEGNEKGEEQACRYVVENVDVVDSLTEDEMIRDVLRGLQGAITDGIEVDVLAGILKENFGITGACCRGLIERIQLELDMYSPDKKRLYFVDPEEPGGKKSFC